MWTFVSDQIVFLTPSGGSGIREAWCLRVGMCGPGFISPVRVMSIPCSASFDMEAFLMSVWAQHPNAYRKLLLLRAFLMSQF